MSIKKNETSLADDVSAWLSAIWYELKNALFWLVIWAFVIGLIGLFFRELFISVWFSIRGQ